MHEFVKLNMIQRIITALNESRILSNYNSPINDDDFQYSDNLVKIENESFHIIDYTLSRRDIYYCSSYYLVHSDNHVEYESLHEQDEGFIDNAIRLIKFLCNIMNLECSDQTFTVDGYSRIVSLFEKNCFLYSQ